MHIEFLLEELSAEKALLELVPRILGNEVSFTTHTFQGKSDLLASLQNRLTGYSYWLPNDWRIVVLVDEDRQDCHAIKHQMEQASQQAGLVSKSQSLGPNFQVLNRIAMEELEAWFLGDPEALRSAFPKVSRSLASNTKYWNPDQVVGGTWENLESILQRAGYYKGGLLKTEAASKIASQMVPERNRSQSFRIFLDGLRMAAGVNM